MKHICLLFVYALIFFSCRKEEGEKRTAGIEISEAKSVFTKRYFSTRQYGKRFEGMGQPDWERAFSKDVHGATVLIVPVTFKRPLFIKCLEERAGIPIEELTKLFVYRDEGGELTYELVTTIPDDAYLSGATGIFTGMVFIESWNGTSIRNYRYLADSSVQSFRLGPELQKELLEDHTQWCYIDFFYCAESMGFLSCSYNFSQAYACGSGGGTEGMGGLGPEYYPVYGGNPGVPARPPLPTDSVIGIGLNSVLLTMPDKPIFDVIDYIRCFHRNDNGNYLYSVVLNVDQPKEGSRAIIGDRSGNVTPWSVNKSTATVGHTWFTFIETNKISGIAVVRSLGFYPRQDVDPYLHTSAGGVLSNDGERNVDVRLTFDVDANSFFKLLDNCSMGNSEEYDIYNNNCTGWSIDKLESSWQVSLPEKMDQYFVGTGGGPTPGNLGEDLRIFDLANIRESPHVKNVNRINKSENSQKNSGNCPKLPPQ